MMDPVVDIGGRGLHHTPRKLASYQILNSHCSRKKGHHQFREVCDLGLCLRVAIFSPQCLRGGPQQLVLFHFLVSISKNGLLDSFGAGTT